jgi:alpha-glucosidase
VINHLSDQHPYFQEALRNPNSKYRDYFYFTEYPDIYNCWWGYRHMPELRLEHEAVREEFITAEESVIRFWLDKGIDGIRLDCANDLGPEVCRLIYDTVKAQNPETIVIGELSGFAAEWLEVLDGVQSYFSTVSIYSLLEEKISASQFGANISTLHKEAPDNKLFNSFTMLSSHDYRRVLTILKNDIDRYLLALILQFTLPGIPMIYYGEEIGMEGESDPLNRAPMRWDESHWNQDVLRLYQRLIKLRKEHDELCRGEFMDLSQWLNNGAAAYFRYLPEDPKQCSLVVVNPTEEKKSFRLFIPYSYFLSNVMMEDLFTGQTTQNIDSYLDIEVGPQQGAIYLPDYLYKKNYSFYKRIIK